MASETSVARADEIPVENGVIDYKRFNGGLRWTAGRPAGLPNKSTRAAIALLRERSGELVEKLLSLTEELRSGELCVMCGRGMLRDEDTRIKALIAALDRGGVAPTQKIEVSEKPDLEWMEYLTADESQVIYEKMQAAKARMPINDGPIVETTAEVVQG